MLRYLVRIPSAANYSPADPGLTDSDSLQLPSMGLLLQGFRFGMTFYFPLALGSKAGIDDIPTLLRWEIPQEHDLLYFYILYTILYEHEK